MPIEEEPIVGAVYEDEEGRSFEVTAFDEDEGSIKVRYEDETVNEIDLDAWYEMELKRVASLDDEKNPDNDDDEGEVPDDIDDEEEEDDFEDDDEER